MGARQTTRWREAIASASSLIAAAGPTGTPFTAEVFDCLPAGRWAIGRLFPFVASVRDCAGRLNDYLRGASFFGARRIEDPEITLVGSRRACRVVRQYLIDQLLPDDRRSEAALGDVRSIRRFRQLLVINPPTLYASLWCLIAAVLFAIIAPVAEFIGARGVAPGADPPVFWLAVKTFSTAIAGVLGLLFVVMTTQEIRSSVGLMFSMSDGSTDGRFRDNIESGSKKRPLTWPIPTRTLRVPRGRNELKPAAQRVIDAINRPLGHPNLYDVELFERTFVISPIDPGDVPRDIASFARENGRPDAIVDNRAQYRAAVRFTAANAPASTSDLDAWFIRYGTSRGVLDVTADHGDNLWRPQDFAEYERDRRRYEYHFRPNAGKSYELKLMVYGGYDPNERRSHTHLRPDAYYWRVRERLDISAYLREGFFIPSPPEVFFRQGLLLRVATDLLQSPRNLNDMRCDCSTMRPEEYERADVAVTRVAEGVYEWEIEGVRDGGVLEFAYVIAKGPNLTRRERSAAK
jgi:hypothetical protein